MRGAVAATRTAAPGTRAVLAVLAVVLIASAVRNIKEHGDFRGYIEVGELVLQGRDIYAEARPDVNTWPPLYSVISVPFALMARVSVYLARAVWIAVNFVLVWGILRLAYFLAYRRELGLAAGADRVALASAAFLVPLLLASRFILGNFDRLQINLLILFSCLAGCALLVRGRPALAGAVIGLAAAIKVLPVFFVPYFAWKRWWTALAATVASGLLATLAPVVVFGPERYLAYVRRWLEIAGSGWPVRKGNQSVYAMVDRLYSHGDAKWLPSASRLTASDDPVVTAIVYGLLALVVVALVAAARGTGRDPASRGAVVEYAIVMAVAVLFSPLAWKHYFVFLLLGYILLWQAVNDPAAPLRDRRRLAWMLLASFAFTTLMVRGIVGRSASRMLETWSVITIGALIALAALLYLRARVAAAER